MLKILMIFNLLKKKFFKKRQNFNEFLYLKKKYFSKKRQNFNDF